MDNLIITFDGIGEASMTIVDDETYDRLFELYENQSEDCNGYSEMYEKFCEVLNESDNKKNFQRLLLQWNSYDHLEMPVTFKRILQVLEQ